MSDKQRYGGQAVIEGVMMRGKKWMATAVRRPDGQIVVESEEVKSIGDKWPIFKKPFIRGVVNMIEMLVVGMKVITFSANQALDDGEEEEQLSFWEILISMAVAFGMAILLFVALPAGLIRLIQGAITSNIALNLIEGCFKAGAFIGYILVISLIKDINRIWSYHGAEHVTINAYERGEKLTPANAIKYTTVHPRCGTNFLFIVIIVSIFFFSFFGRPPLLERILIHIALLPVVAGTAYELLKKAGEDKVNPIIGLIARPGLWVQKLTTRKPAEDQIEVAIAALAAVLEKEQPESFASQAPQA